MSRLNAPPPPPLLYQQLKLKYLSSRVRGSNLTGVNWPVISSLLHQRSQRSSFVSTCGFPCIAACCQLSFPSCNWAPSLTHFFLEICGKISAAATSWLTGTYLLLWAVAFRPELMSPPSSCCLWWVATLSHRSPFFFFLYPRIKQFAATFILVLVTNWLFWEHKTLQAGSWTKAFPSSAAFKSQASSCAVAALCFNARESFIRKENRKWRYLRWVLLDNSIAKDVRCVRALIQTCLKFDGALALGCSLLVF